MSRAFVREDAEAPPEPLAETPVSPHRNLVTPRGLALLSAELARLDAALASIPTVDAAAPAGPETAAEAARLSRDRRYVARRLASAEVVPNSGTDDGEATVTFGCSVTLALAGGRRVRWRLVGEDEADPAHGRIAWTAPVAGLLLGLGIGDEVVLPAGPAEIVAIDAAPEPVSTPPTGEPA